MLKYKTTLEQLRFKCKTFSIQSRHFELYRNNKKFQSE